MNDSGPTHPAKDAAPPSEPQPKAVRANPSMAVALLNIIRTLVDFGQKRLAAIQARQLDRQEVRDTGHAFGTFNLSVIVARIMRGLRLAAALEQRVVAASARPNLPQPLPRPRKPRAPRPTRRSKLSEQDDNNALLARMPTDREIAAMIRHRPIGKILDEICADLGIGPGQPQWQELWRQMRSVIAAHRGKVATHLARAFRRAAAAYREVTEGLAPNWIFYSIPEQKPETTGPPIPAAT
jgi:hypothetical protein